MIKAITFDLWDTVIHDDSDEPKRAARGLRSKRRERRHLVWQALKAVEPIDENTVTRAYDIVDAAFNHVWHEQFVTWTVRERLTVLLRGLARELPAGDFERLVRDHEEMEIRVAPDPTPAIGEALDRLADIYPLAVVSDAIVSPGRCLREWLAMYDLLRYFTGFAFSDEVGHSKPHRAMFAAAAQQMGVAIDEMVHIGDREHNDIKGPHELGMKAVLYTGTRDRDKSTTTADAICEHHRDLPGIIERLAH